MPILPTYPKDAINAIEHLAKIKGWDTANNIEHSGNIVFRDEQHDGI